MSTLQYTLKEIIEKTGLARTTLFKYLNIFDVLLADSVHTIGRTKYIDENGLQILRRIVSIKECEHKNLADIKNELLSELQHKPTGRPIVHTEEENGVHYLMEENKRFQTEIEKIEKEKEYFKAELRRANEELSETKKRHDTIILQFTKQLENQQKLLEYHQSPFWRRWFGKRKKAIEPEYQ